MQQSTTMRAILVAGAAVVAAGTFAMALGDEKASGGTAPIVSSSGMTVGTTVGNTATTTTSPTVAPLVASPVVKATVPCGFTTGC
jgi:hypothetical protein